MKNLIYFIALVLMVSLGLSCSSTTSDSTPNTANSNAATSSPEANAEDDTSETNVNAENKGETESDSDSEKSKENSETSDSKSGDSDSTDAGGMVKFSSVYTEMNKCKSEGGEDGGHVLITCTGPGGYTIKSFDSARFLHFAVEGNKFSADLATQTFAYDSKNRKAEWRLADGKPFALIMRFNEVVVDQNTESAKEGKGEYLIVKGLRGFERINFTVDARKISNANEEARRLADSAHRK